MDKVQCGGCGRDFEYLVDMGLCEDCLQKRLEDEED